MNDSSGPMGSAQCRAALAAVNSLHADQQQLTRDHDQLKHDVAELKSSVGSLRSDLADTASRVRSLQDGQAEIKAALIRAVAS